MSMVGFPLILIPLAIYNIIVFLMPGVSFAEPIAKLTLMSGAEWTLSLSDMLLALGILLLLLEIIKGARPGAKYLTDHLLSLVVFGGALAEFLLWPRFGTSSYFLLAMLALVDFLSGVALRVRRGAQLAPGSAVPKRGIIKPSAATSEPQFDRAPAPVPQPPPPPSAPEATSVAESVLQDHPEPTLAHPGIEVASNAPSPEVPSPGLQPASGSPSSPETPPR
jgi:hypothetical protein